MLSVAPQCPHLQVIVPQECTKKTASALPHVLVQPEMERGRSPLVSIPPFGRGFPRHRYDHQAIPQHGCVPAMPASVSPGKIIVTPQRAAVSQHPVCDSAGTQTGQTRIVSCDRLVSTTFYLIGVCQLTSCTRQALAVH